MVPIVGAAVAVLALGVTGAPAALQIGAPRAAMDHQRRRAEAGLQRCRGVFDEELPRRAAHLGAVGVGWTQAEIFGQQERMCPVLPAAEEPDDVLLLHPGIGNRGARRLLMELQRTLVRDVATVGLRYADDTNSRPHAADTPIQSIN